MRRVLLFLFLMALGWHGWAQSSKTYLIVGTYTDAKSAPGIHVLAFDQRTGRLRKVAQGQDLTNPSFLTLSADGTHVYACTDTRIPGSGSVTAFRFDPVAGRLSVLSKQPSGGENPVYLTQSRNGGFVVNANYTEGTVTVFPVQPDGSLKPYVQRLTFAGTGPVAQRQDKPHVHAVVFSPDQRFVFVPDLGADRIRVFEFAGSGDEPLRLREDLDYIAVPGSGPRHLTFHPNGRFAYCVEELSGTVMAFRYAEGRLDSLQRISACAYKRDLYSGADIHISPDGRYLYASNRIENTIAIFSIEVSSGLLTLVGHQSTLGDHPRNFTLDPTGRYLLVGNLLSNSIVVFRRDLSTGLLRRVGWKTRVAQPACLRMHEFWSRD